MRPAGWPGGQIKACLALWFVCMLAGALAKPAGGSGSKGGYDGKRLIMKVDCSSTRLDAQSADALARQLPFVADVENCTALPVECWLQCEAKPSASGDAQAADTAGAETDLQSLQIKRVTDTIASLVADSPVSGVSGPASSPATSALQIAAAPAASAATASPRRCLFSKVGRSRLAYTAVRRLQAQQQLDPGSYPSECSANSCSAMWGMNRIKVPAVWRKLADAGLMPLTITRPATMIDTGADADNNNIKTQMNQDDSRTFAPSTYRNAATNNGKGGLSDHGSHTFCTVAGAWNAPDVDPSNIAGVVGAAQGKILSCNAFGNSDGAGVSDLVKCLSYAVKKRSHWVINMSLGVVWPRDSTAAALMRDAMQVVCDSGGIVVVAAANSAMNVDDPKQTDATYPAAFAGGQLPCVIAVAAVENGQGVSQLAPYSNWGTAVKIAAPGSDVRSCINTGYGANPWSSGLMSGTSMASPHVAGAALLLMNAFPTATNTQVRDCLIRTATDPVGYDRLPASGAVIGGGVLDVDAAYTCMQKLSGVDTNAKPQPPGPWNCSNDALQDCEVAGLCTAEQGCRCSRGRGQDCTCNAQLGFIAHRSNSTGMSRCRWNITYQGNRFLEVPLNGQVTLPIPLPDGFCPASGIKVVKAVNIREKRECPVSMQQKLQDTAASGGLGAPLGESCGRWMMSTSRAGATAGSCYRVQVITTDRRSYNLVFRYY